MAFLEINFRMKTQANQYKDIQLNYLQTDKIYHFQSLLAGIIKGGDICPRLIQRLCKWAPLLPIPYVNFWIGSALAKGVVISIKI